MVKFQDILCTNRLIEKLFNLSNISIITEKNVKFRLYVNPGDLLHFLRAQ